MSIVVHRLKRGVTFQARVRDLNGSWYPSTCFSRREDAMRQEADLLAGKRKGAYALSADAKIVTLDEYWKIWKVENRTKSGEGWKISQDQMYKDYIEPVLGSKTMVQIRPPDIGRVLSRMREKGKGAQTTRHVYGMLRRMFSDAVEYYEMLSHSPVKAKFHRPEVLQVERPFLVPVQSWHLLESCKDHYAGPAIWLQLLAGMRAEAVIALLWNEVHWHSNQIFICRGWKQKLKRIEDYPKGKKSEYVPMIPGLRQYLLDRWEKVQDHSQYVCTGPNGGKLSFNTYSRVVKSLCKKASVPEMTTHELRHSCSEIWIQAGASSEDIRRLLNHNSLASTKRYIHRTDDRLHYLGENIGKPLSLVVGKPDLRHEKSLFQKEVPILEQSGGKPLIGENNYGD